MFRLSAETARDWAVERGIVPRAARCTSEELSGGVSATVVAVRWNGRGVVLKQARARLRVEEEWLADTGRTDAEAAVLRVCARWTPGSVPRVVDHDAESHIVAIELVRGANWQAEIGAGRPHLEHARWAGRVLGTWHRKSVGCAPVDRLDALEQLRLQPFHETVIERRPEVADQVDRLARELREQRRCLVHGDYAPKNMLVGEHRSYVLDFEVAHFGNPVFDLAFFLSFLVLSAVRWPSRAAELRVIAERFLETYRRALGGEPPDLAAVTAHTGCLVLARTDGKSPASFLGAQMSERCRVEGIRMLLEPERGLWC